MKKFKIAGFGEVLWDMLPSGKVVGGAPLNFAYHTSQFGCEGFIISALGSDTLGMELMDMIKKIKVKTNCLQVNHHLTGTVEVKLDNNGTPTYKITENVAWDFIAWDEKINKCSAELDAVCWGTLAQREKQSQSVILQLLQSVKPQCLKVFDCNFRGTYFNKEIITTSLKYANVFKCNEEEWPVLESYFYLQGTIENQIIQLANRFDLAYLAYTMGKNGSIVYHNGEFNYQQSLKINIVDTVGAGDCFTAVLTTGILNGLPIDLIHKKAVESAGFVCTQAGATPTLMNTSWEV